MPTFPDETIWGEEGAPSVALIKLKYRSAGLHRWDNNRVSRLFRLWNCTIREGCATAGMFDSSDCKRHWERNQWPMTLALHFAKMESYIDQRRFGYNSGPGEHELVLANLLVSRQ